MERLVNPQRWKQVNELFHAVLGEPLERRGDLLARYCNGDSALSAEVESLLAAHHGDSSMLESPAFDIAVRAQPGQPLGPGKRIGRYTIRGIIGRGGMGTVYEAEQDSPRRSVALKVLNRGNFSEHRMRRFEREADILARLRHPGIARIYEAVIPAPGDDTPPFLALERIEGLPLTDFAEQRGLSLRERVLLAIQLCDAVAHAHLKGVVHRDLKPSNILVDENGRATVLDFGIARLSDPTNEPLGNETQSGQLLGTLPFMSPEQAGGSVEEVDVRSDVYALGVVLYVLFSGRHPYELANRPLPEALHAVREQSPAPFTRPVRGSDLETIILKAMNKEPDRRYQSASELGIDLNRFANGEPIAARRDSALYVVSKALRRSKRVVAATTTMLLLLIVGLGTALLQWSRAEAAVTEAIVAGQKERDARVAADEARSEAEAARADAERQRELAESTAREAKRERQRSDIQAREQMMCLTAVLNTPHDLRAAVPRFRETCEEATARVRSGNAYTANCFHNLARLLDAIEEHNEAVIHYRHVIDIRKSVYANRRPRGGLDTEDDQREVAGPGGRKMLQRDMEQRRLTNTLIELGGVLYRAGRFDEAEAAFHEAVQFAGAQLPPGPQVQLNVGLARTLVRLGRFEEAETALLEASEVASAVLNSGDGSAQAIADGFVELYEEWHAAEPGGNHAEQCAEWQSHRESLTSLRTE